MSDYLKANHTYDLTKNIKDIEVNTGFILGLDAVLMYYFANVVDDPATLPTTFKKFERIIKGEDPDAETNQLSYIERQIYTLFALQQLFKAKAKEQNLEVPMKSEVTKQDLENYMRAIMNDDEDAAKDKLSKIEALISVDKSS